MHPLVAAYRFCQGRRDPLPESEALATALFFRCYLASLFRHAADDGTVGQERLARICRRVRLPYPRGAGNEKAYDVEEFERALLAQLDRSIDRESERGAEFKSPTIDELVECMLAKSDYQWHCMQALNARLLSAAEPESADCRVRIRDVQLENLTRELVRKRSEVELLKRFATQVCRKLAEAEGRNLAAVVRRPRPGREAQGQGLSQRLGKINVDLHAVRNILAVVQPTVEHLERLVLDGKREQTSTTAPPRTTALSPQQTTMYDSVADSGCLSDDELGWSEALTTTTATVASNATSSAHSSDTPAKIETTVSLPDKKTEQQENMTGSCASGVSTAQNMRQRLGEISQRLRDTDFKLKILLRNSVFCDNNQTSETSATDGAESSLTDDTETL